MSGFIDFILHLDDKIQILVANYGPWAYAILFAVIFAETGLVVTPFLPGDSLLFMLGLLSRGTEAKPGAFNPVILILLLSTAAILGDQLNYRLGMFFGERLFKNEKSKIFRRSHLVKTQEFYAKHGPKTVMLARFVPVVRALAPFVAGMGRMDYKTFCSYSVLGAFVWVGGCVGAGFALGGIPIVREKFEIGILAIVLISAIPMVFEFLKHRKENRTLKEALAAEAKAAHDAAPPQ
ncbi:MAG: DedA family protein [Fimbriimonas sp.]